ncbi:MAG TPA: GNAT family N-acetyltransferase [Nostocaceae cyanobacterium]|nr:GNAT family N-acetyltransferase [Nostocaceae cyanobacterium]
MKIYQFDDVRQFYAQVKDYLLHQEAMHNLPLKIINNIIDNPDFSRDKPYLASVDVNGDIIAVALITPPKNLILSQIKNFQAIELLAQSLYSSRKLPGVIAPKDEAEAFSLLWHSLTNQDYKIKHALRVFQLEQVQFVGANTGFLRPATNADIELLTKWHQAFSLEALGGIESDAELWIKRVLKQGNAYLWQDKVPVSLAYCNGITANGATIGPVYTPPEYRRRGYASACVAALSQTLLNRGHKFCFLFTDLANPTSNHIYQEIGYQPVGDWLEYSFL